MINKVSNIKTLTIDLGDFYPKGERVTLDIKCFLQEEILLKEKLFRIELEKYNWEIFKNKYVAIHCSSDTILPSWTMMLICAKLSPMALKVVKGDLVDLENVIYQNIIDNIDLNPFKNKRVIINRCSKVMIPENAYLHLVQKLRTVTTKIMYGEICSAVPLY
ncbi:DUF2480 family protein [Ichthyobacterium seriolicida]|uniref:DUF2480 family protein n=1 Tax=Ichthyobacterium seriolicida TaxID=242600 RepID=A0A1J1EA93_9FLAO|nr:DUF2480 family protein [Ichthyobacterium seriolicida]BAV94851.1 hypothetical protein JBKA6_0838 [Ichthyobacterium seriolicida]